MADDTARVAHLEAARRQRPRRWRHLVPLSLLAADPVFSDLGTAAPVHQPNIQAIDNAGITTGFADPNNPAARLYDPKANVTREEMASFLARTAGLGANPPVANAAKLGGVAAKSYVIAGEADFAVAISSSVSGPLPKSTTFTSHGGRVLLFLSGSSYANLGMAPGGYIGVIVTVDGTNIGTMLVAVNDASHHHALIPLTIPVSVPAGVHTVTFTSNTTSGYFTANDGYDGFSLTTLELPVAREP